MSAVAAPSRLLTAPPAPPRRPRVLLVATAFGAVASAAVVLTILAAYLQVRAERLAQGVPTLPEEVVLPLTPGNMGLATLGMSVITVAWVSWSLRNDDRTHAYLGLGLSILLGVAFINATAYLYTQLAMPFTVTGTAGLIYIVTGAHLAMTIVGLVYLAVMGFQALGGQLTGRDAEGFSAAALYWYVTVAVYAAVWYGVYITK